MEYIKKSEGLLGKDTPLVFADGTETYAKLGQKYIQHDNGFFILAPSGSGKTYFTERQKEKHWIDGDEVWMMAKAHPDGAWWIEDIAVIDEIDQRSDVVTVEAKRLGFWIIGASNYWLKPDAVVIPDWKTHQEYVKKRETEGFDGGASSMDLERLQKSRDWMSRWQKEGVPLFISIEDAVTYLTKGST